ncbi:MAG TPA: cell division protein FtsL [Pyrinomonadaceae bacterium]
MIRRVPSKQRNALTRESGCDAFLRFGLLLVCGLGLASGFVYAGRQHFAALNYGYETENLRRERDQLVGEQRRFLLEREAAASPVRLERAAKQLGMQALEPAQVDPLRQPVQNSIKSKSLTVPSPGKAQTGNTPTKPKPTAGMQTNRVPNKPI